MSYKISTHKSWNETLSDLKEEFRLWGIGVADWDVIKPGGRNSSEVHVTYKLRGKPVFLRYDKQNTANDNLRAIFLAIQDMRMLEVREVGELVESHYKQLGSGDGQTAVAPIITDPWELLGVKQGAEMSIVKAVYKTLAIKYHPDNKFSGNVEMFKRVNAAFKAIEAMQ